MHHLKTISFMSQSDFSGDRSVRVTFTEDCGWQPIAAAFYQFLKGMHFTLTPEEVGGCFVKYLEELEAVQDLNKERRYV